MYRQKEKQKRKIIFFIGIFFTSFTAMATLVDIAGKQPPKFSLSTAAKSEMTEQEITAFQKSYQGILTDNKGNYYGPDDYESEKMIASIYVAQIDSLSLWLSTIQNPFYVVRKKIEHELALKNKKFIPKDHKTLLLKADRYNECIEKLGLMMGLYQTSFYVRSHEEPIMSKQEQMEYRSNELGIKYPFTVEERNSEARVEQLLLEVAWKHRTKAIDVNVRTKAEADFVNQCFTIPLKNFFYEGYFDDPESSEDDLDELENTNLN